MARRIASRKRKHYGNRTFGAGNTKNRRGKGSKGGVGRAGFHKHKWMKSIKAGLHKSLRVGFVNPNSKKFSEITLEELAKQIIAGKWPKDQKDASAYSVAFPAGRRVKVIGTGAFSYKAIVSAAGFTKSAKEKIEKAGGSAAVQL